MSVMIRNFKMPSSCAQCSFLSWPHSEDAPFICLAAECFIPEDNVANTISKVCPLEEIEDGTTGENK